MANKHLSPEQLAKLTNKNAEYTDMLIREMNTNTWTPSEDGRRKAKDRVTQTITLLLKLQTLLDGPNKGKGDARGAADAAQAFEVAEAMKKAKAEAAMKVAKAVSKH